jgi:hypothetical protein
MERNKKCVGVFLIVFYSLRCFFLSVGNLKQAMALHLYTGIHGHTVFHHLLAQKIGRESDGHEFHVAG